jgi:fructose-specific phosphotransferase system IIA component
MTLRHLIHQDHVQLDMISRTKEGAIFELSDLLAQSGKILDLKEFIQDIKKREVLGSTGIGFGIAIPHAKSSFVIEPAIVFGRSIKGIDFDAMDFMPAHLFFMIAMPEEGVNLHLKALAMLSRHLMHESFRERLMDVLTKEDFFDLIKQMDQEG